MAPGPDDVMPRMRIGIVASPASIDDHVVARAVRLAGATPVLLDGGARDLDGVDALVLPTDAAIMPEVVAAAGRGLPVLGIGPGFGALCRAGLLPGEMTPNDPATFVCRDQRVRVVSRDTVWTCAMGEGDEVTVPVRTAAGRYRADAEILARLEGEDQVVLRYVGANPTGSLNDIAGITNARGNVVGVLPHPEHAVEELTSPSTDGRLFFASIVGFVRAAAQA